MKRWISLAVLFSGWAFVPCIQAQEGNGALNHVEVGAFGELLRIGETGNTDLAGVGARVSINLAPHIQLEAETGYDFSRVFTETFSDSSGSVTAVNSNLRTLHGLFGPKIQTRGPVKLFLTAKGGAIDFMFDTRPPSFSTFTSSVDNLRTSNVSAVFYPGGGAEAFIGPVGLRFEVGDEMYFNSGAHHNLRVSFGPSIRF
jgi:hypothetical protein